MRGQRLVLLSEYASGTTLVEVVVVHGPSLLALPTVAGLDLSPG